MVSEFKLVTPEDAEDWTMSVPRDMVTALAKLRPSEFPALATRFADVTAEELGWSSDDFFPSLGTCPLWLAERSRRVKECISGIACNRARRREATEFVHQTLSGAQATNRNTAQK